MANPESRHADLTERPLFFFHKPMMVQMGMLELAYTLPIQMAMGLVFVYGIAYFYVYQDLVKNRNCAKLGVYSKTTVFVLSVYCWLTGEIVFAFVIPGIVDIIFAGLYLEFLMRYKPVPEE